MKQFGGILPLCTGLTVPKGVDRYHNQSFMNIAKSLLDEKSLEIGTGKVKPARFARELRELVTSNAIYEEHSSM